MINSAASVGNLRRPTSAASVGSARRAFLCFHDGPDCRPDTFRIALNLGLGRGESGEREMANVGRIIAAPNIDEDFSYSPPGRSFAAHSVGPKAIDLPFLQCTGSEHPEGDIAALAPGSSKIRRSLSGSTSASMSI